ncbi:MAG: DSD1 family PLP-dependent enzyme [Planctomycetota bacterium]
MSTRTEIDTPALLIDLHALERNIQRLRDFCQQYGANWRPHAKSYKSSWLARRVVEAGAIGVTCAKLGEAELYAAAGIHDLLITCPLVGPHKMTRLVALAQRARPIAVVDHPQQVNAISQAAEAAHVSIRLLIEIDIGMQRCGVAPGAAAVELARFIQQSPGVELAGIMGWEGHALTLTDLAEKQVKIAAALEHLKTTRAALLAAGLPCDIVSAGGSGSFPWTVPLGIATEIQAGGAILMDQFYRQKCSITSQEIALTLISTVTSRPTDKRVVLDFGRKSLSPDLGLPKALNRDDLQPLWLSAEHAVCEVTQGVGPQIGDRVEWILGYGDWTTVLHDYYYVCRGEQVESVQPLDARGRAD